MPGACNVLRTADSDRLIVLADFAANGRTTATFRELVGLLRADRNIWELAPVPFGREGGMTGQDQVDRWVDDIRASGLKVDALIGFCAGGVYAAALAERIATWQEQPRLILIDPSLGERQLLIEHVERWLARLGSAFSPAQLADAKRALRGADASAAEPLALADALAELYRRVVKPALVRAGHSAEASHELASLVAGFLHWLAGTTQLDPRAAWSNATALSSETPGFGLVPPAERAGLFATVRYFDVPHSDLLRNPAVAHAVDELLNGEVPAGRPNGAAMDITDSIKDILATDIFVEVPPDEMAEDDSLRDVFGLDSVGFVELRIQCQNRFGVTISTDDFTPENFATIRSVRELVERLRGSTDGATAGALAGPR